MICSPAGISFTLIIELVCACNFCTILLWSLEHFYSSQDRQLHYNVFVWSLLWLLLLLLWFVRSYLMFNYLVTFTFFFLHMFWHELVVALLYIVCWTARNTHAMDTRMCAQMFRVPSDFFACTQYFRNARQKRRFLFFYVMWWMTNKSVQSS